MRVSASRVSRPPSLAVYLRLSPARQIVIEPHGIGEIADLPLDRERFAQRIASENAYLALARLGQPEQHENVVVLPAPLGPSRTDDFAFGNRQIDAVDDPGPAIGLARPLASMTGVLICGHTA